MQCERRGGGNAVSRESALLSPFLHVILDEFFSVFFQNVVDFIDQLIDVFFHPLTGLNDFGVSVGLFFPLRLVPTSLFSLL